DLGSGTTVFGSQPTRIEHREMDRWAGAIRPRVAIEQMVQSDGARACERYQVDVRIECRTGCVAAGAGGFDPVKRRKYVWAATQQVCRQRRRQRQDGGGIECRPPDQRINVGTST